jgi:hypothetical protein
MAYQDYQEPLDSKAILAYQAFQVFPDQKALQVREN